MRIQCPHCRNTLNVVSQTESDDSTSCPLCGSELPQFQATVAYENKVHGSVGRFQLHSLLGVGQFGQVWEAKDARIGRTVALKLPRAADLDERAKAMFLREARAAAAVKHPNVVTILDVDEVDGQIYIASELVLGQTLKDRLKLGRPDVRETAAMMATVAEAIHEAHKAGVIHRDLKPSNILLNHDGVPHVSDFGLAKQNAAEITLTASGMILGTPAYMSPEQARGDGHRATAQSDIYSLGVVLYEMLTGRKPFDRPSTLLLQQIQSEDPRPPRSVRHDIPKDLETICLKALEKLPAKRYESAAELADDLKAFLAGAPILARRSGLIGRVWRKARRNTATTIALAATAGSLTLFVASVAYVSNAPERKTDHAQYETLVPARDFIKPSDQSGPLTIKSSASFACIQTGRGKESFQYEIDAELQYSGSLIGIAFGIHQTSVYPPEYRCLVAFAGVQRPLEGYWLTIEDSLIRKNSHGINALQGQRQLATLQISDRAENRMKIRLEVTKRRVTALSVNGIPVATTVLERLPELVDEVGVGIVALGHAVIRKQELMETDA